MRIAILLMAVVAVAGLPQVRAQGGSSTAVKDRPAVEAPIGHRQPRAGDVPNEKNLSNPNTAANKEDAELDKKIKSICRGC